MSLIKVTDLTFGYAGAANIFENASFNIDTNWKLGLTGRNGRGKTTFLKLLLGCYGYGGTIAANVAFEYFPYDIAKEDADAAAVLRSAAGSCPEWRIAKEMNILGLPAALLGRSFRSLSNGERTKILLAALFLRENSFLLIDEPTNHLDMRSKDVLKEAIRDFDGTVIIVSHDRDFLDGLATKVYEFGGGLVKEHLGGIYDFLQKKQIESLNELQKSPSLSASPTAGKAASGNAGAEPVQPSAAKLSYEEQKELNKKLKKLERRVADCEAEIEQTEAAIAILEARMATPEGASDMSLYEQHQKLKEQLDRVMEEWDAATVELENH